LGRRDCGARGKKKSDGNGNHLVHKAWLLANRPFPEINALRSGAFLRVRAAPTPDSHPLMRFVWPKILCVAHATFELKRLFELLRHGEMLLEIGQGF
jgi:hypothetical protein